jgi:hypothetical protein
MRIFLRGKLGKRNIASLTGRQNMRHDPGAVESFRLDGNRRYRFLSKIQPAFLCKEFFVSLGTS